MLKKFKCSLVLSSFLALILTACPGGDTGETPDPNKITTINVTGVTTLEVGQGATFNAQALNSSSAPVTTTFTWSSSNSSVLEVEAITGKVTAKKTGSATIEATASDSNLSKGNSSLNVTMTLRINTRAYGEEPITIFISNADGSLSQSKTVVSTEGFQRLEFPGVSSDAFVTAAYKYTSADTQVTGVLHGVTHYRLSTYPASAIKQNAGFYFGSGAYFGNLTAQITKPNIASVTRAGGTNYHWCCTYNFGTGSSLTLNDGLYSEDLQTDGTYSPVLFAYDTNGHMKAYASFLDQTYDPNNRDKTFTVAATDWKTNLSTTNFVINNVAANAYAFCSSIQGYRKGILINPTTSPCDGRTTIGTTVTAGSREYVPSLYDQLEYTTGWAVCCGSNPGDPSSYTYLSRRVSSIPATITLNALTDFLPIINNFTITNTATARPTLQWDAISSASNAQNANIQIYDVEYQAAYDYFWDVNELPNTTTTFNFPELPATLSDFAPKEGLLGHKYRATVSYSQQSLDATLRQYTGSRLNFDLAAVTVAARNAKNFDASKYLERSDRFTIRLKQ
jgi:Bacterial Ig-like domain (group 2)